MKTITKNTEQTLINEFIAAFKKDALKKKKKNKRLSLVLTGGRSPVKLYQKLAKYEIDWSNIDLFWGDERFVSQTSKNSNYKLAYDTFIKKIKINKKNLFSVNTKIKNASKSSEQYSSLIKNYFKNKPISFDYFILGMGSDGHVASIFPNSGELSKKFIAQTIYRKDFVRITLGLNIINNSKKIILWLNNSLKSKRYNKLKIKGKKIPINNLNKKRTLVYKIC
jgi:6-phosphogluconolactonase